MQQFFIKSLIVVGSLGLSMNSLATSDAAQSLKDKAHQNASDMKEQAQKKKEVAKHDEATAQKKADDKVAAKKDKVSSGKNHHGKNHHGKKHLHRHAHHKHFHHKHFSHKHHPQHGQFGHQHGQGQVREAAPRVPGDNSGKKMDMNEYNN